MLILKITIDKMLFFRYNIIRSILFAPDLTWVSIKGTSSFILTYQDPLLEKQIA
ncbi:MAG: hypothetical protein II726_00595 [Elusimicrobiaceae bacterium]|nr:hypothetical protein [Elusimicrobiaceae bacterium]